jgi:30S ribosomal protein S31
MARAVVRVRAGNGARPAIMRDMGKGDKRTRRGKIYKGSYGKKRPQRTKKAQKKA